MAAPGESRRSRALPPRRQRAMIPSSHAAQRRGQAALPKSQAARRCWAGRQAARRAEDRLRTADRRSCCWSAPPRSWRRCWRCSSGSWWWGRRRLVFVIVLQAVTDVPKLPTKVASCIAAGTHWNMRDRRSCRTSSCRTRSDRKSFPPEEPPAPPPLLPPAPVGMSTQTCAQLLPSVPSATAEQACELMSEKHWFFAAVSTCFPAHSESQSCAEPGGARRFRRAPGVVKVRVLHRGRRACIGAVTHRRAGLLAEVAGRARTAAATQSACQYCSQDPPASDRAHASTVARFRNPRQRAWPLSRVRRSPPPRSPPGSPARSTPSPRPWSPPAARWRRTRRARGRSRSSG